MKTNYFFIRICLLLTWVFLQNITFAQSPGIIIRPAGGNGTIFLNPNGDGLTSSSSSGFVLNDITESEILYKVIPPIITEPTGDLATGPTGGFSDIVRTNDNSGLYLYYDGINLLFRLRIGNIISGSKGYSILLDTDGKMGNSGPLADPNYVASTNTTNGNPGFEFEIVFATNFNVSVYNVDGSQTPVLINTYPLATNSQISVALSFDSGNPDYFYDFGVPFSAIGSPASFRVVATTVTSPSSALQGSRSDIYGIDDLTYRNTSKAWESVINSQPSINPAGIGSSGSGPGNVCTAPPTMNSPIAPGSNIIVSGSWTRLDISKPSSSLITLYKNGISVGTTAITSGNSWSIIVSSVASGDVFYAKAQSIAESMCLQSGSVIAGCSFVPAAPVLTCASSKGISGTIGLGNSIMIYLLPTSSASPTSIPLTTNITYPTPTTFAYYVNGCSGGINNVTNGTYMLMASNGNCTSSPIFECISSGSSALTGLVTNAITLTTPIYPYQTSISGTGVASGNILRLFINGIYISTLTATSAAFSFSGLILKPSDQIKIYVSTGTSCMAVSNTFTVSCYTSPPQIITSNGGNLIATVNSVSGTSAYSGATVTMYQGIAPSGVILGSPTTTNSSGDWIVPGITITAGQNYYATQTVLGCISPASSSTTALTATTICPVITGSYTDAASSVSGTLTSSFSGTVRLYLDKSLIGSVTVSGATSWSIPVNTSSSDKLYSGGMLTATSQSSSGAEKIDCAGSIIVSCSAPLVPSITPVTSMITTGQTVNYSISNSQSGILYSIKDNILNTYYTTSKFGTGGPLTFTTNTFINPGTYNIIVKATSFSGADCQSQSVGTISVISPLPLSLLSFEGALQQHYTQLKWTTSNEINVSRFELQRSDSESRFYTIGNCLANNIGGTNLYSFKDPQKIIRAARYRLLMIDLNGRTEISRIIKITNSNFVDRFQVLQNPFTNKVDVLFSCRAARKIGILLTDIEGRVIRKLEKQISQSGIVTIKNLEQVNPGLYFLQIIENGETILLEKIMKFQ